VEGGIDALAIVEWNKAHCKSTPCIIVSGGAGVRSFLDQPHAQKILKDADAVYVALEREKDAGTQAKTDADHQKQIDKIWALGCEKVFVWEPPAGTKDIADAWKAGILPDPHGSLAHMRQDDANESASMPTAAPAAVLTFGRDDLPSNSP
jgi:hypothetical protein